MNTLPQSIEAKLAAFEEKWHDDGDERYGRAKHNNTILQYQLDWLRAALREIAEETVEATEQEAYDRKDQDIEQPETAYWKGGFNYALHKQTSLSDTWLGRG